MGYACPVCETPQQDANHLANHLAFTAMVHNDDHEAWLDEHIPAWSEFGESELAPQVARLAPEADYDQVFEDTTETHGHADHDEHEHDHAGSGGVVDPEAAAAAGAGSLDDETREVLEEARELTAQMLNEEDGDESDADSDERDADSADSADSNTDSEDSVDDGSE